MGLKVFPPSTLGVVCFSAIVLVAQVCIGTLAEECQNPNPENCTSKMQYPFCQSSNETENSTADGITPLTPTDTTTSSEDPAYVINCCPPGTVLKSNYTPAAGGFFNCCEPCSNLSLTTAPPNTVTTEKPSQSSGGSVPLWIAAPIAGGVAVIVIVVATGCARRRCRRHRKPSSMAPSAIEVGEGGKRAEAKDENESTKQKRKGRYTDFPQQAPPGEAAVLNELGPAPPPPQGSFMGRFSVKILKLHKRSQKNEATKSEPGYISMSTAAKIVSVHDNARPPSVKEDVYANQKEFEESMRQARPLAAYDQEIYENQEEVNRSSNPVLETSTAAGQEVYYNEGFRADNQEVYSNEGAAVGGQEIYYNERNPSFADQQEVYYNTND